MKGNEFGKIYQKQLDKVNYRISRLLQGKQPNSLYEPCSYIIQSGGKRLRPLLVLLTAKAAGGSYSSAYNAAVAIELLHNFTLVHDDIMDNADKRRGRPTIHKKYDLSTAILSGDSLLAVAYINLLKDCKENDKKVLAEFTKGVIEICEGQSLDKDFEARKQVSLQEYLGMIRKKTAVLLEVCCSIGAMIGGGTEKQIKALSLYGRNLGMAFQIQDDLLDLTADEAEFGKITGGDLVEGKKTFLFIKALEKARGKDKKVLLQAVKNKGISREEVPLFKEMFYRLGIIDDCEREISRLTGLAVKQLDAINEKTDRDMLIWLANSLIRRTK